MDTCHNSTKINRITEKARDLLLVATLEYKEPTKNEISIFARVSIPIWPKKDIAKRELEKKIRRLPKGQQKGVKKKVNYERSLKIMDWDGFDNLCKRTNIYGQAIGLNNCEIVARLKKWKKHFEEPQPGDDKN